MDISGLSIAELQDLQKKIERELKHRESRGKIDTLKELRALAEARGYTLEQLLDAKEKVRTVGTVKVKYRHPQNVSLTWTGRGRQPRWVSEWQAAGGTLEQLAV